MEELSHMELPQGDKTCLYMGKRQAEVFHVGITQCDKIHQCEGKR